MDRFMIQKQKHLLPQRYKMSEDTPWEKWKKSNKTVKPWDLLNPNIERVDEEVFNYRYNICQACPSFINLTKQCKKCACIMNQKAKLSQATCPLGKWGAIQNTEDVI